MNEGAECAHFKENRPHEKDRNRLCCASMILARCDGAHAQKVAPKSTPVTIAPDLTKLNIEKLLQQVQTTKVQPSAEETSPLQVVTEFLRLRPGQVSVIGAIVGGAPSYAGAAVSNGPVADPTTR